MVKFILNGKPATADVDPSTPILWTLRDSLQLTGTKFGCGMALCGACTVHLDGQPIRGCVTPVSAAEGKRITTVEGVGTDTVGRAVQDAWARADVPQCGYCQSGQIMSATALLRSNPKPTDDDIDLAIAGNIWLRNLHAHPRRDPRRGEVAGLRRRRTRCNTTTSCSGSARPCRPGRRPAT